MSIDRNQINKYFDNSTQYLMAPTPHSEPDGNGLLYTSTLYVMLCLHGFSRASDKDNFLKMVAYSSKQDGLLTRGPHKSDELTSHDDYIGVTSASAFFDSGIAKLIYDYGKDHGWFYGHRFFGRLLGLVQHFKLCAGIKLDLIDKLFWALDIYRTTWKHTGATSSRILDWLKIQVYKHKDGQSTICNWAVRKFENDISKRYSGKMGNVFSIYFDDKHPFSVIMKNKF